MITTLSYSHSYIVNQKVVQRLKYIFSVMWLFLVHLLAVSASVVGFLASICLLLFTSCLSNVSSWCSFVFACAFIVVCFNLRLSYFDFLSSWLFFVCLLMFLNILQTAYSLAEVLYVITFWPFQVDSQSWLSCSHMGVNTNFVSGE